jgi:hypothetical protein
MLVPFVVLILTRTATLRIATYFGEIRRRPWATP